MRWLGILYTPLMAIIGLLLIVFSLAFSQSSSQMMIAGSILAAGACIGGAIQQNRNP